MERKKFIHLLGLGAGAVVVHGCLGGCAKNDASPSPQPGPNGKVDFTLLNIESNQGITSKGWTIENSIIIAKSGSSSYLAVSAACTHEGTLLEYKGATETFSCIAHGSIFNSDGTVNKGPAQSNLKSYRTQLINGGTDLRVFEA